MNSIGENCNELKRTYDACFNSWFADKFLKGSTDESQCEPLFKVYQQCVKTAMKEQQIEIGEVEADHLGSDKEYKPPPGSSSS
ncbi:TP53-regulated inhibitor of apoptosis 1-like [Phlebotomus argentipes]|uniref:TP53-regulated inhibitor of apoptosis 1-like n=1 Tax=Phlebotomus argentipes TaxID=94469 RepID=UPI002892D390|nr:TP53-regulated inhibitor of apoptosis 1-like [Phlebotomus argentipes]